jgi:hypothetical protein
MPVGSCGSGAFGCSPTPCPDCLVTTPAAYPADAPKAPDAYERRVEAEWDGCVFR